MCADMCTLSLATMAAADELEGENCKLHLHRWSSWLTLNAEQPNCESDISNLPIGNVQDVLLQLNNTEDKTRPARPATECHLASIAAETSSD